MGVLERHHSTRLHKQGYIVECLKSSFRKSYCRYGDLIQQYEVSLSQMLNDILTLDELQWLPNRSDFPPNFMALIPDLTFTELRVVSMEHLQRVWLPSRERLPVRTPASAPPPLGTCLCFNCWDKFYRTCRIFSRLFTLNTPWYFLDFAPHIHMQLFLDEKEESVEIGGVNFHKKLCCVEKIPLKGMLNKLVCVEYNT